MRLCTILIALFFGLSGLNLMAQQDTLFVSNGDILVGEIKSLNRNVLTFKTDYGKSEFDFKWAKVKGLIAATPLVVYTEEGQRYTGQLKYTSNENREVVLISSEQNHNLNLHEIVKINTYQSNFLQRINVSVDAGYSFTKANNLSQFSMTGQLHYKVEKWRFRAGFNSVATRQDDVESITRNESIIDFDRDVLGNAYVFAGMEFLENSEQKLDLRTTSKVGAGYYFLQNNSLYFKGGLGIANANEKYGGNNPSNVNSFEGLASVTFDAFDIGDFSFRSKISAFPSFSNKGRVRLNSDVALKYNLPLDFYVKASLVYNYDNKPLNEEAVKLDYVFQTSIGWEWN